MDVTAIALQGLEQAEVHFERAAKQAGAMNKVEAGDSVDLSAAAVELLAARAEFAANLKMRKMAGEIERGAIDLLG
ncbi:MAG TPA: hypothetical protein VGF59_21495 [Bryobacteraceae bacterium]|jgi:hypothetical protein